MPASSSSQIAAGPKIHQLWQAVILKPFKLQECILHFWKPLIFINLVSAGQDHSYVLNTRFWLQKRSTFHRACVIGVLTKLSATVVFETNFVNKNSYIFPMNQFYPIKFRLWSNSKFLGLIDFSYFFTEEDFDNKCELFIS